MFSSQNSQVSSDANYIEDVFSTYLYTGNGSTQTITNGIDLSTKGGLTWIKRRQAADQHHLFDTVRGATKAIYTDSTVAQDTLATALTAFNANGFTLGSSPGCNYNGQNIASWTFRKQAKFFDVVTYTGNGTTQAINHNLGSVPGCIIVKCASASTSWAVYHRSVPNFVGLLNSTSDFSTSNTQNFGNNTNPVAPTSTQFTVGQQSLVNSSGETYVAYLFAHDAGGFGLTGSDNVISCGSFTEPSSGSTSINLGWEPQWVLVKPSSTSGDWYLFDNMRGMPVTPQTARLFPNLSDAEVTATSASGPWPLPTATGFDWKSGFFGGNTTFIYIAIRRGPMKVPTSGTSVFSPQAVNGSTAFTTNFPVDLAMFGIKAGSADNFMTFDRQRGSLAYLKTTSTAAEGTTTSTYETVFDNNTGSNYKWWSNTSALAGWNFQRAPSFFDEVCYTGNGSTQAVTHNLGVAPEIIIVKNRTSARDWFVYLAPLGVSYRAFLNLTNAPTNTGPESAWGNNSTTVAPTSTQFTVGTYLGLNASGENLVAYLFATCAGVSKVGSYTGNGTTQTIDCGFTGGARFVLIKRTDSTGDWYVYDTARGMTVLTDPYLLLNSTAAESATLGSVTTVSTGFAVNASILAAINTNGASYIFLAIS